MMPEWKIPLAQGCPQAIFGSGPEVAMRRLNRRERTRSLDRAVDDRRHAGPFSHPQSCPKLTFPNQMKTCHTTCLFTLVALVVTSALQAKRPKPPVRPFDAPGAPKFIRLDDKPGVNPPVDTVGNFLIGPDYRPAPERRIPKDAPRGKVSQFIIDSKTTKLLNPGIARKVFGKVDPKNPKTLIVETHEIDYFRQITVYVPAQYKKGSQAPFMVCHDGPKGKPNQVIPNILDNLIAQKRVPPMIVIQIANGGGDAQGHQRGKEYDTMSGLYAEYIEVGSSSPGAKKLRGDANQGSRRTGSDGKQFGWFRRSHHGLVPDRSLPSGPDHFRHLRESAVALRSENTGRRLGLSRQTDPELSEETHPALSCGGGL